MDLDRERLERCLAQVQAYRASGLKGAAWAAANGVGRGELQGGCAHPRGGRAGLGGAARPPPVQACGFVALGAPMVPTTPASIRVELGLGLGAGRIDVHWPLSHARELATWLREFSR